ncbi:MAG TPA: hypothetical protein VE377_13445 [Candidatus Dormibacteraeota bacterium]|nr:hypothetical protein [Candidatus Dormibacteraeota bacterium]
MPPFRWEDIDHSLVSLRLTNLAEEMHSQIEADERHIQFENRGNLNGNAVPSQVLKMKEDRADESARRTYEIYCDVWDKQGYVKSASFVRAVFARGIVPVLRARKGAIAGEFSMFAKRTSFPPVLRDGMMKGFQLNMQRMEDRWRRRLEIEAKECEHAEKIARLSPQIAQGRHAMAMDTFPEIQTEPNRQFPAGEISQPVHPLPTTPHTKKPGRSPRLSQDFVVRSGTLWREAIFDSPNKVSLDQLRQIASELDAAGHSPPSSYLEGKYARDLKEFNSRNSNSKIGPLKTWSQLVSHGDKDHLQGMRRLLCRCAEKVDEDHPPSGIDSGQKTSS